ncbi:Uncharacterised protein [Serratia entomophila]|nr:Uncharacterised protein [Serratia entomophila]
MHRCGVINLSVDKLRRAGRGRRNAGIMRDHRTARDINAIEQPDPARSEVEDERTQGVPRTVLSLAFRRGHHIKVLTVVTQHHAGFAGGQAEAVSRCGDDFTVADDTLAQPGERFEIGDVVIDAVKYLRAFLFLCHDCYPLYVLFCGGLQRQNLPASLTSKSRNVHLRCCKTRDNIRKHTVCIHSKLLLRYPGSNRCSKLPVVWRLIQNAGGFEICQNSSLRRNPR